MVLALVGVLNDVSTTRADMPRPIQPFAADAQGGISTNLLGVSIASNYTITQALKGERTTLPWIFSGPGFTVDLEKEILNPVDDDGDTVVNDGCAQVGTFPESGAQCLNNVDDRDADPAPLESPGLDGVVNDGCPPVGAKEGPPTFPLSQCQGDYTKVGTVWTNVDAGCDGVADYMYERCTAGSETALKWYEATTAVEGSSDAFLKVIMPPFSWLARHQTPIDHICLPPPATANTISVLNTIYAAIPYSPNASTFVAQTKLGGSPTTPPSLLCLDSPQNSTSVTTIYNNPPLEGDFDRPCNTANYQCADAGIYGMWTDNTVELGATGNKTITVNKHKVNNGPEPGVFTERWDAETTDSAVAEASWVPDVVPVGPIYDQTVTLDANVDYLQTMHLQVTCKKAGTALIVLKNILFPVVTTNPATNTKDTYLDDNSAIFTVQVLCGGAVGPSVDKEVVRITPVIPGQNHLKLEAGQTFPVMLDELKVNHGGETREAQIDFCELAAGVAATQPGTKDVLVVKAAAGHLDSECQLSINTLKVDEYVEVDDETMQVRALAGVLQIPVKRGTPGIKAPAHAIGAPVYRASVDDPVLGREWLVAETILPIIATWQSGVTFNGSGVTTQYCDSNGDTVADDGCIYYDVLEPHGQSDVVAQLNIHCSVGATPGLYPVVVKAIDDPLPPYTEIKASDNAQRSVISVWCGPGAGTPDSPTIDDGNGLYARWTILQSQGSTSLARASDLRKVYTSTGPSIPSDIGYVERIIDLQCFWIDADGCLTCDQNSDTIISETDSWTDDDMPAGIDTDGDCLAAPGLAQPGHPVDLPMNTGTCDKLQYSENPMGVTYSKEKDADCDGLVDGIEKAWGSNPKLADSDGDGAPDFVEMFQFTNPVNPDTDGDALLDKPENNWVAASIPSLQCGNEWDDDGDGKVNDGCPPVDTAETAGALCNNNLDDDADTVINDGCIAVGTAEGSPTSGEKAEAANLDDNCPTVYNPDQLNSDGQRRDNGPSLSGIYASNPNQDKLGDACDDDNDNDGAINGYENLQGTNPLLLDTDGDTVNDGAELLVAGGAPLDSGVKPGWTSDQQVYYRGCRINVNALYTGFAGYAVTNGVEFDPDGDGSLCPTDKDSDNGTGTGSAGLIGISDKIESYGFGMSISSPDTDGDGCEDWIEVMDINGDRFVDSGDQGRMDLRVANPPLLPPDPVSDKVYDVNKDKFVDSGDQGSLNMNTCDFKNNIGGCPQCPAEN